MGVKTNGSSQKLVLIAAVLMGLLGRFCELRILMRLQFPVVLCVFRLVFPVGLNVYCLPCPVELGVAHLVCIQELGVSR